MSLSVPIESLVPGGVRQTDHLHVWWSDDTCSRCRREVPENQVPLMLFLRGGSDMLIYCEDCCTGANDG